MPSAQLIEDIVKKVLAEAGLSPKKNSAALPGSGPKILILAPRTHADAGVLRPLLPQDACLEFIAASGSLSAENIRKAGYNRIILPFVSLKALADLALGRASGRTGRLTTLLLMAGQKVHAAAFEHDRFKDTAPPALFSLYQGYEKTVAGFGLSRLQPESKKTGTPDKSNGTPGARVIKDRLVTEARIAALAAQGINEIQVTPKILITALARDLAREKGIRLIFDDTAGKGSTAQ